MEYRGIAALKLLLALWTNIHMRTCRTTSLSPFAQFKSSLLAMNNVKEHYKSGQLLWPVGGYLMLKHEISLNLVVMRYCSRRTLGIPRDLGSKSVEKIVFAGRKYFSPATQESWILLASLRPRLIWDRAVWGSGAPSSFLNGLFFSFTKQRGISLMDLHWNRNLQ